MIENGNYMKNKSKETKLQSVDRLSFMDKPYFPIVLRSMFFLFSFLMLGVVYDDTMLRYFWKSYFLYDAEFAKTMIFQPGGLLYYWGRYLNQFFSHPWLGGFIYSGLLVLVQWLVSSLFDGKKRLALSYLPSFFLLLYLTQILYGIYWRFEAGVVWTPMLGTIYVLLVMLVYRKIGTSTKTLVAGLILSLLTFPFVGCVSFIAMMVVALSVEKGKLLWVSVATLSWLLFPFVEQQFYPEHYTTVLYKPLPSPLYLTIFVLSIMLVLVLGGLSLLKNKVFSERKSVSVLLLVASVAVIVGFVNSPNSRMFRAEAKIIRLTDESKWNEVLKEVEDFGKMTHTQNAFRVIALGHLNRLDDKLFDFPLPFEKVKGSIGAEKIVFATPLYFHSSFFSLALQMNMEIWTSFGEFNEGLKTFALIALMTGEDALAEKYIRVMKKSAGMEALAEKYDSYLKDKNLMMEENPYLRTIQKHMYGENVEVSVHTSYVALYFAYNDFSKENVERRLLANLYAKNLAGFLKELGYVAPLRYKVLPDYFQEAVAIYAILAKDNSLLRKIPVTQKIGKRVSNIIKEIQSYGEEGKQEAQISLRKKYPNSYAYFYFFDKTKLNMRDLK